MKLLVIDPAGNGLDFAVRAQRDGHAVKHFIRKEPKTEFIGRGFIELVPEFQPWLGWADLVFNTDNTFYLRELDAHRARGGRIVGASSELARWELDRDTGMKVFREHGIAVPDSQEFANYDKAIAYVRKEMRAFVSKPSGDADKTLSYVSKGPADLVYMLERWKGTGKLKGPFILQEKVEGIEMAVGAWMGVGGWRSPWCENWEFKKLCVGDLGCQTGEQGTVLRYVKQSKLADLVLKPLTRTLVSVGYIGYIDVNCMIDERGQPWPLEFTMRPGWPTFNIQEPLHDFDVTEWLMSLTQRDSESGRRISTDTISLGVVLSIPDYPYSHLTRKEVLGVPVYGLTTVREHVHPCALMAGEAPQRTNGAIKNAPMMVTAGDYVLVMTATSPTVRESALTAYRRLRRLTVPNSPMWRTDIGRRLAKELPKLQSHGYAMAMSYSPPG